MKDLLKLVIVFICIIYVQGMEGKAFNEKKFESDMRVNLLEMSSEDKLKLIKIFKSVPDKFKYSITAIYIVESNSGKYIINFNKGGSVDCGPFHVNSRTVASIENVKHNSWNKKLICSRLIEDFDYSLDKSLNVLKYYHKRHKGNWFKTWGSYNGGNRPNTVYAKKVRILVKLLKEEFNEDNITLKQINTFIDSVESMDKKELEKFLISIYGLANIRETNLNKITLR